jgi:beta-lactamase regulating signal transducer with metallopeptidase domain
MTLIESMQASANVLGQIVNPAARAVALAGAAAAGLAAFRVKNTSVQLSTWRAVLYAALAMPLLGWLLPPLAISIPAFLQSAPQRTPPAEYVPSEVHVSQTFVATAVTTSISTSTNHADNKIVVTRNAAVKGIPAAGIGEHTASAPRVRLAPAMKAASVAANPVALSSFRWSTIPWAAVAVMSYLAVALFFLARFGIGLLFGRRLLNASQKIDEPRVALRLASRAHYSGLTVNPRLAESELISVPVTMGALRSTILLPASWREWDEAKLDAILAHEVSHVARRDGLTQRLSLLHRAIFWFSPLAWWLDRHLSDLAEQASDEAALSGGADRNEYARTLLGFFEALNASPGRVWWQGVAMAKAGQAERQAEERLERILSWKGSDAMGAKNMNVTKVSVRKLIAVAVVVLAVPVVYLAAAVCPAGAPEPQHLPFAQERSTPPAQSSAPTQPVQSAPATPQPESLDTVEPATDVEMAPPTEDGPEDAPAPPRPEIAGEIHVIGPVRGVPSVAPMAPLPSLKGLPAYPPVAALAPRAYLAPRTPIAPAIWSGQTTGSHHGGGYSYHYGYDDDLRFVIATGKSDSFTMSGSAMDARHVEKLKKSIQGDFIWFQRDEKSYLIRDQATIDRAQAFWAPEEELGKKQEALGAQQEVLGKQQEELGKKMEEVQINVPDMTAALDKLKAKLQKLGPHATMDQIGDLQSEIGDLQSKIGDLQSQAGDAQGKLGEQQGALGEKQGKLGEEQGKLGEQQAELARKATIQMKSLLDDAIKNGIAQPEL